MSSSASSFPHPSSLPPATQASDPHAPLRRYGWDAEWADAFAPYEDEGLTPARILRVDRNRCTAFGLAGQVTAAAPDAGLPCTGDWAALGEVPGGQQPAVRALLPRRTAFLRSASSNRSEAQVLAANVDHAVVLASLERDPDLARLERFVALAWAGGAQPLVVLTKADLLDPGAVDVLRTETAEGLPGVEVLAASAESGEGIEVLTAVVAGGTSVLLGQSGAGKSTLANALLGEEAQGVGAVRAVDGKGRHTTTARDLLPLPVSAGGGVLIDTPGLRGVALWDAAEGVERTFAEIEELAAECRFHDCAHRTEPDCAVLAAIEEGRLPQRRLDSYRKLLRENTRIAARSDARLRAEQRQLFKQRQALGRHMMERKRGPHRKP